MYAFWQYDLYPYVLGGKVIDSKLTAKSPHTHKRGLVQVEGYAVCGLDGKYRSGWFRPILLLPDDDGEELAERLDNLARSFRTRRQDLERVYRDHARNLLAAYGAEKAIT